jgi:hypothetical protein
MGNEPEARTFVLTIHAARAVSERGIELAWIERALTEPDEVRPDPAEAALRHSLKAIPEHGGRVLRVVVNVTVSPRRVVTVFFDRRERRRP